MITPITYAVPANGAVGGMPAAVYWWGKSGVAGLKYPNSTGTVEAGWLSGFFSVTPVGSNLPIRDVVRYLGVTRTTRFGAAPTPSGTFFGMFGKNRAVFPGTGLDAGGPTWRMSI